MIKETIFLLFAAGMCWLLLAVFDGGYARPCGNFCPFGAEQTWGAYAGD